MKFLTADREVIHAVTHQDGVYRLSTEFVTAARAAGARPAVSIGTFLNSPNPFKPSTRIRFDLPAPGKAEVSIFDFHGRRVAILADGTRAAGTHELAWDATGFAGGTYFCRLRFSISGTMGDRDSKGTGEAETTTLSRKLLLLD